MNEVLAISLHSIHADMARLEQIGMNLANVLTPGYKRGVAIQAPAGSDFAAHLSRAMATWRRDDYLAPEVRIAIDTRAGTLKSTSQGLDVAIAGQGYFEVITEQGPAYTRQGSFRVDERGRLVTAQGDPVMGALGEIILNLTNPVISEIGAITSSTAAADAPPLAQLKVVDFDNGAKLQPLGAGLFAAGPGMKILADREVSLRQGFVENSNVSSTHEMADLLQAMRHFESMQKVAQGYDEMLGAAIRKLGETS